VPATSFETALPPRGLRPNGLGRILAAGVPIAGVDLGASCRSPAAAEVCQEFYEELVDKHGLHRRARLLAHSHGGLIAYGWAFRHPAWCENLWIREMEEAKLRKARQGEPTIDGIEVGECESREEAME
jgi:hypothetical protein